MTNESITIDRKRIGRLLADCRENAGLTVRDLAGKSGINHANITKLEQGYYNASIDVVSKILAPLGKKLTIIDGN